MPGGETINISEMAKKVSEGIFEVFGWSRRGPADENWPCKKDHRANGAVATAEGTASGDAAVAEKRPAKTHPSDVVFRYDDPYTDAAVYLTTDLKSFATNSIKKSEVAKALRSLCAAVDCANVVGEWADRYVSGDDRWHAHGMLFIYNHDGEYKPDAFRTLVGGVGASHVRVPDERRTYVFGPGEIAHLHAVARDLKVHRGETDGGFDIRWFTPDLVMRKSRSPSFGPAAPAEVLLGPWQLAGLVPPGTASPTRLRLYYRCRGETSVEELEYLLEFLFRHHLLEHDITLCFVASLDGVLGRFQSAVSNVVAGLYDLPEFRKRLDKIKAIALSEFAVRFSTSNIGMERQGE